MFSIRLDEIISHQTFIIPSRSLYAINLNSYAVKQPQKGPCYQINRIECELFGLNRRCIQSRESTLYIGSKIVNDINGCLHL